MSTQTKQQIKHVTQMTTGVLAVFIIYVCTFTVSYLLIGRAVNGTQNNRTVQETQLVSKTSDDGF